MWLFKSSLGRKLVMSLTGAFLILFVTFHVLMNAVAIFSPSAYNAICEFLGANWYALIGSMILAAGFLIHILFGIWLTLQNRKARGGDRYAVTTKPVGVEWSSQNMLVLGFVVLAFLGLHLVQFWAKMQLAEVLGTTATTGEGAPMPPAAGTLFIHAAFSMWWTLPVYLIGFIALWFHMTHGFWSMFQSAGFNGRKWIPRLKTISTWWTTIVIGLFCIQACWFTYEAHQGSYINDPELQKTYYKQAMKPIQEKGEALNAKASIIDMSTPEGQEQMKALQSEAQQLEEEAMNVAKAYNPAVYNQMERQRELMQQMNAQQNQPAVPLEEVDSTKTR